MPAIQPARQVLPISFTDDMALAAERGYKTETRRLVPVKHGAALSPEDGLPYDDRGRPVPCRYGAPGALLWARVAYAGGSPEDPVAVAYRFRGEPAPAPGGWKAGRYMPRWAAQGRGLWLECTGRRAERLSAIAEAGALAEGVVLPGETVAAGEARERYLRLWDELHAHHLEEFGAAADPLVWVITFRPWRGAAPPV